jgi:hypothetical protein
MLLSGPRSGTSRACIPVGSILRRVVENGQVLSLDRNSALDALAEAQQPMERTVPARDYKRREAEEIVPSSLPLMT